MADSFHSNETRILHGRSAICQEPLIFVVFHQVFRYHRQSIAPTGEGEMIGKTERYRRKILLALDLLAVLVALPLAYALRSGVPHAVGFFQDIVHPSLFPFPVYLWFYLVGLGVVLIFYPLQVKVGSPYRYRKLPRHVVLLVQSAATMGFCIGFLSYTLKLEISRSLSLLFLCIVLLVQTALRVLFTLWFKSRKNFTSDYRRFIVAGNSPDVFRMGERVAHFKEYGYYLLGYVTDQANGTTGSHGPVLGRLDQFGAALESDVVDEVIYFAADNEDLKTFEKVAIICEEQGIVTRLSLNFFPHAISSTALDFVDNQPFLTFSPVPQHQLALVVKRLMDIVGSLAGIAVTLALSPLISLLIKANSRGRTIYSQTRCGKYGRRFTLYKFRSMKDGADDVLWEVKPLNEMNGPVFKMRNDPRVTSVGRVLRKWSIDELPQFFNVLKGEMSLVGPRAPLPEEVAEYTRWQKRRLSVKPGLTCLWQVSGRNQVDFDEWMRMDLQYIDTWSLWLDVKIILKTVPAVAFCRGAR